MVLRFAPHFPLPEQLMVCLVPGIVGCWLLFCVMSFCIVRYRAHVELYVLSFLTRCIGVSLHHYDKMVHVHALLEVLVPTLGGSLGAEEGQCL